MKLSQFEYNLPKELISNTPMEPRDHSKLLVLDRSNGQISHHHFFDLPQFLTSNDVLVFNKTKVFPAKLIGKKDSGGAIEILLLKKIADLTWEAIGKGKINKNSKLIFDNFNAKVLEKYDTKLVLEFDHEPSGQVPLPPYIHSPLSQEELTKKYQTVYAKEEGSVAAPTAGFHFTNKLLKQLKQKGVECKFVTLHVGLGTFLPVKSENIEEHTMHSEEFSVSSSTALALNKAKLEGKRIICVGTTTTRVLESITDSGYLDTNKLSGSTNIFIYPGYKFKFIDSLITNFHLPHSTLLALVSAFVSKPNTDKEFIDFNSSLIGNAYKEAINKNYRFYSFGDASFIV